MLLAEIAATLWFLAFGAVINLSKHNGSPTFFEVVAAALLVAVCLVLSVIVIARIIIRGLL